MVRTSLSYVQKTFGKNAASDSVMIKLPQSSKCCKFVRFFLHLTPKRTSRICYKPAKYQMNILQAVRGVDFTRYALLQHLSIDSICTVVENWLSLNGCKFVKNIFLQVNYSCTSTICLQQICKLFKGYTKSSRIW